LLSHIAGIVYPEKKGATCESKLNVLVEDNEPLALSDVYSEKKRCQLFVIVEL